MIQNKMEFSMYINKFFKHILSLCLLAGCAQNGIISDSNWSAAHHSGVVGTPSNLEYGFAYNNYGGTDTTPHTMTVLLPLSGDNAQIGDTIRSAISLAALQNAPDTLNVSFYDSVSDIDTTMQTILSSNPDIIIGPVFSSDANIVRRNKPSQLPVLSFTSDAQSVGDGVMSVSLIPSNGVETIIREMKSDDVRNFIIIAPDTNSGHMMAGTATVASEYYELPLTGIFYYKEHDSESIKQTSVAASMNTARTMAHTRARQVLSDILTNERLTTVEKSNLNLQLEKLSKTDTLGSVPYDAILFLGNGEDTKSLVSFLRYYNVGANDARFYGTTMWDGSDIASDFTMMGSKYASLPSTDSKFTELYTQTYGVAPTRLASFGYDAANMAIGMIYSNQPNSVYLMSPSGYIGTSGLYRLLPNGLSERALNIVKLNGGGTPEIIKTGATDFSVPMYNLSQERQYSADAMELQTNGIDPDNYIRLPLRLRDKYSSKTIGANTKQAIPSKKQNIITITSDPENPTIQTTDFQSVVSTPIQRTYIEEYEIEE